MCERRCGGFECLFQFGTAKLAASNAERNNFLFSRLHRSCCKLVSDVMLLHHRGAGRVMELQGIYPQIEHHHHTCTQGDDTTLERG